MRTYLMLSCFWLAFAAVCFAQPFVYPEMQPYTILDTGWSIGWVMLAFAAFNALRWWMTWPAIQPNRDPSTSEPLQKY